MEKEVKRYNVYYTKYNIFANDYVPYIRVVETDDIFHYVGKMLYTTFEKIERIRWTQPKASREDCMNLWLSNGYTCIGSSMNYFVKENFKETERKISEDSAHVVRDFAKWLIDHSDCNNDLDCSLMPDYVKDYLEGKKE